MKQLFRRYFPRRQHPLLDRRFDVLPRDEAYARAYEEVTQAGATVPDDFIRARYKEGQRWRGVVSHYCPAGLVSILDIGGGNGAVELAFSADERFSATSVEMSWNDEVRLLSARAGKKIRRVIADAARLPFRSGQFEVVTCLETVEHLRDPVAAGREVARVTRQGGVLLITTPPRLRYLLGADPHFGIRGLALLPAPMQRWIVARRGFREAHHHVDKLYGSVQEVVAVFRGFRIENVLSRSRAPRRWFWDALVLRKD